MAYRSSTIQPSALSSQPSTISHLHPCSRLYHAVFGDDDDAVADVIAVAVGLFDARLVGQLRAVADPRVLVDDDPIEHDVAADAESRPGPVDRAVVVGLVEVGPEQHRSPDRRAALDVGAD